MWWSDPIDGLFLCLTLVSVSAGKTQDNGMSQSSDREIDAEPKNQVSCECI